MGNKSILSSKILLFIFSCFRASYGLAADTLYQGGDALNSSRILVSQNGLFTLGFVSIGSNSGFNASYLGIWYNNESSHPFWLAYREKPIEDDSGVLAIDGSGNMKLTHSGGDLVRFYSSKSTTTNLTAVLEDSGNFVLKEANSRSQYQVLWQSFDYPTDSYVTGMKLGINRRTNQTWSLTSWLSEEAPSPGSFTLEWDPNGQELVIKRRGAIFWSSRPLIDGFGNLCPYINASKVDEDYLMLTFNDTIRYPEAPIDYIYKFSRLSLQVDGTRSDEVFYYSARAQAKSRVMQPFLCDGNSTEGGCERWEGPKCRSNGERFELRSGSFSDDGEVDANGSLGIADCMDICWKNCSCVGVSKQTYINPDGTGCRFWFGNFTQDLSGASPQHYIIVHGSNSSGQYDKNIVHDSYSGKRIWIWIVVSVLPVVLIIVSILWSLRRRRLREKFLNDLMTLDATNDIYELQNDGNKRHNLKVFNAGAIMAATNSFSTNNKLGQGGFGPVYKGKLPDGQEVAIKRLSRYSGQGLVEFKNELVLIAKLQHMNLVRLLGCCIQGEEKMLVYEFMPNKSLDSYIFDQSKRALLDWKKRLEIIEGIAQGLLYLHKYSRLRIIHRDLKASNILLDENLNPKISDFGMARIFKINESEANTNRIVGTYGYMSPEYAMEGIFSVKSDVFSFGILVLEIVGGRRNRDLFHIDPPLNLVGYAWELWKKHNQLELVDPTLRDSCSKDQVLRCIHVGLLCVEDNAIDRPTMSDVVSMLTSEAPLPLPKQPAFSNTRNIMDTEVNSRKAGSSSINNISMSTMEAR